jgi:hypothetical protein
VSSYPDHFFHQSWFYGPNWQRMNKRRKRRKRKRRN